MWEKFVKFIEEGDEQVEKVMVFLVSFLVSTEVFLLIGLYLRYGLGWF
jgi:hypothetical protein